MNRVDRAETRVNSLTMLAGKRRGTAGIAARWIAVILLFVIGWLVNGSIAMAQSVQSAAPIVALYDVATRSFLYLKAADQPAPPASLVKLLTAETVFHALAAGEITLEQEFAITESVWRRGGAPSGSAAMFAPLNSRVAVSDLLQGLIVMSGNDAALALAEGIGKSEAAFVTRMEGRAKALGLTRSQFRNATGHAHPEQRVTAREMALLAAHVITTYPDRYPLFGQREFTWNKIRQTNRNPLLAMNIGADGLKTGNIAEAGFNLIGSAVQDGRRLIVVIMGAESAVIRAAEARKLLEWGFRNFERRKLLEKAAPLTEARVSGGVKRQIGLGVADDIEMLLPKSSADPLAIRISYPSPLKAPLTAGQAVGTLSVMRGDVAAYETPVIALEDAPLGSMTKRAFDNSWDFITGLFRRGPPKT
jgi:serine-type D-Ala-D-Ala carboxypeptidase (penicillin-binding protein 5/6)